MMRKIICILVCMLLCVTASTVTATGLLDKSPNVSEGNNQNVPTDAPWTLLDVYDIGATGETGLNGNAGAEFDGTYLYSTRWASNLIHRYDIDGNLVEEFSIPGVTGLRDLAYDGTQYMYGGAAAGTIWKMDFTTKTLVATLTGSFQSRAITYDWDLDVIYCSNWADPVWIVDPSSGAILGTFNLVTATSTYGFAYDSNGPTLWIFDQTTGATSTIYEWDLTAGAMTGFSYNVNNDVGSGIGIAGGLWASPDYAAGLFCIGGCVQDSTAPGVSDWLFAYELYTTNLPPVTPGAPSGPPNGIVGGEYTFTATTTDPEGDPIEYWFEWGDGQNSGWVSPGSASHIWTAPGNYPVTVKAKDINGGQSGFSPESNILIESGPMLEITEVKGGLFFVKAKIKNAGADVANNVDWTIHLEGGAIIGADTSGQIPSIPAGGEVEVKSKLIFGFGATKVTVTADIPESSDSVTRNGFVLLLLVKVNIGG